MVAESDDYSIDCSQESRNAFVLHSLVLRSWGGGGAGHELWQEQGKGRGRKICSSVQAALFDLSPQ